MDTFPHSPHQTCIFGYQCCAIHTLKFIGCGWIVEMYKTSKLSLNYAQRCWSNQWKSRLTHPKNHINELSIAVTKGDDRQHTLIISSCLSHVSFTIYIFVSVSQEHSLKMLTSAQPTLLIVNKLHILPKSFFIVFYHISYSVGCILLKILDIVQFVWILILRNSVLTLLVVLVAAEEWPRHW